MLVLKKHLFKHNDYPLISRLLNGRIKARRKQLNQIASLLEMNCCETNYAPCNSTQKQS